MVHLNAAVLLVATGFAANVLAAPTPSDGAQSLNLRDELSSSPQAARRAPSSSNMTLEARGLSAAETTELKELALAEKTDRENKATIHYCEKQLPTLPAAQRSQVQHALASVKAKWTANHKKLESLRAQMALIGTLRRSEIFPRAENLKAEVKQEEQKIKSISSTLSSLMAKIKSKLGGKSGKSSKSSSSSARRSFYDELAKLD